ncbi:MAG TPA: hypothetical protein O0X23_05430 [Methanocorpusculum sp.]|nr:hypothetical protein [Methanocorpusculum sp.]
MGGIALLHAHVKTASLCGHCITTAAVKEGLMDIDFEEIGEDMTQQKTVTKKYKAASFSGCDRSRIALDDALVPRERMCEIAIREISVARDQLGLA